MGKNQKITAIVVIIALAILGRFFFHSQVKTTVPPIPLSGQTAPKSATPPAASGPSVDGTTKNPSTEAPANNNNVVEKSGLCHVDRSSSKMPVLSLHTYEHLRGNKQISKFVLPAFSSECLPDSGTITAHIVSYSAAADRAYDYWGDVELEIKRTGHFATLEALFYSPDFNVTPFGFKKEAEVLDFLMLEGGNNKIPLETFDVTFIKASGRTPVGTYSFYPYVKMIENLSVIKAAVDSHDIKVVDLRLSGDQPFEKIDNAISATFPSLDKLPIVDPAILKQTLEQGDLASLDKDQNILLVGLSPFYKTPYNVVQILLNSGFKNISILQNGYADFKKWNILTPTKVKKLQNLDYESFADLGEAIIIDTRLENRRGSVFFKEAYLTPIHMPVQTLNRYDDMTKFHSSQTFDAAYDVSKQIQLKDIKHAAENKKIVLIGENEYDWGPVILYETLRKVHSRNVYWLRHGFDGLVLEKKLNTLDVGLAQKLLDVSSPQTHSLIAKSANKPSEKSFARKHQKNPGSK